MAGLLVPVAWTMVPRAVVRVRVAGRGNIVVAVVVPGTVVASAVVYVDVVAAPVAVAVVAFIVVLRPRLLHINVLLLLARLFAQGILVFFS